MRKNYSGEFKAKIAIAALKGDRTLSKIPLNHLKLN